MKLIGGDCLEVLKTLQSDSIDSIVTDPPYGISFMNKHWDYQIPSVEVWRECLRVLKPGGHALIACGTRTQHRMAVNIEDAGFEIRDVITWLYGSGFPKSLDVSKAIDKAAGAARERVARVRVDGKAPGQVVTGFNHDGSLDPTITLGAPVTDLAKQWAGYGTALKPACEFWTLARKPLGESTVAKNVLKHGVGGINVDGCRVEAGVELAELNRPNKRPGAGASGFMTSTNRDFTPAIGRFPANLILDEEAGALLDAQSGELKSGGFTDGTLQKARDPKSKGAEAERVRAARPGSAGGASRFFYCAKASKSERNAGLPEGETSNHPTVKPLNLMRYLCRLITPPGGIVLDPFMGSGSTGVAAREEGFDFLGVELMPEYLEIAKKRVKG